MSVIIYLHKARCGAGAGRNIERVASLRLRVELRNSKCSLAGRERAAAAARNSQYNSGISSSSSRKVQFIGIPSILKACSVPISNQRHPTVPFDPHRMASATGRGEVLHTVHSGQRAGLTRSTARPVRGLGMLERMQKRAEQATARHKYKAGGRALCQFASF